MEISKTNDARRQRLEKIFIDHFPNSGLDVSIIDNQEIIRQVIKDDISKNIIKTVRQYEYYFGIGSVRSALWRIKCTYPKVKKEISTVSEK